MLVKVTYDDKTEEQMDIPKRSGADALQQAAQQVTTRQRRKPEKRVAVSMSIVGPDPDPGTIREDGKWRTFSELNPTEQQDVRRHIAAKELEDAGDDEYVRIKGRWAHVPGSVLRPLPTPTPTPTPTPAPEPTPTPKPTPAPTPTK